MAEARQSPAVVRVILYVKDIPRVAAFYQKFFAMQPLESDEEGWLELESSFGSCRIALHQASKAQKSGSAVKIVFAVEDVYRFRESCAAEGLEFGPVHAVRRGAGHEFANAQDPAGNSISISNRGLKRDPSASEA